MILSKTAIIDEFEKGNILYSSDKYKIQDFCKNQSVDIHLGDFLYFPENLKNNVSNYFDALRFGTLLINLPKDEKWFALSKFKNQKVSIPKNTFFLAYSEEFIGTAKDSNIHPQFSQRSTLARLGLSHTKAGWGDVGFANRWCMEFYTLTDFEIVPNMKVGQISFEFTTDNSKEGSYSEQTGNYQNGDDFKFTVQNWRKESILPKKDNY